MSNFSGGVLQSWRWHGGYEGAEASHLASRPCLRSSRPGQRRSPTDIKRSFADCHDRVRRMVCSPRLRGMGTTCTAIALVGHALHYVHVGDTRLYLIRDGQITQITQTIPTSGGWWNRRDQPEEARNSAAQYSDGGIWDKCRSNYGISGRPELLQHDVLVCAPTACGTGA